MTKTMTGLLVVAVTAGLVGCTGSRLSLRPMEPKLVERIPNVSAPAWTTWTETMKTEKDGFVFIGRTEHGADYDATAREAEIDVSRAVAEQLSRDINTSLQRSRVGQNVGDDLGREFRDMFIQESRNVKINGLAFVERFGEKWVEDADGSPRYFYKVFVRATLSKADFYEARQRLLDLAAGRARTSRDTNAARLLDEFRNEIKADKETARQP